MRIDRMRSLLVVVLLLAAIPLLCQDRGQASLTIGGKSIGIDYGRPALKGRDMLGRAADGMVWRFGKDAATTLKTGADLELGSIKVPRGVYTLFAKKIDSKNWHLIVNKKVGEWGTEYDATQDLYEIPLNTSTLKDSAELFTLELKSSGGNKGTLTASWGTTALSADFVAK